MIKLMKNQKGSTHLLLLFIVVTIISGTVGFSLGKKAVNKQLPQSSENEAQKVDQVKILEYEDKLSRLTKFENLSAYSTQGTEKSFNCFSLDKLPTDSKTNKIKQELESDKRLIDTICSDSEGENYIVNTYVFKDDRKVEQRIDLDTFTEPDFFTSEFIYQEEIKDSKMKYFKLNKWFNKNELVFSLIQWPNGGPMAGNANSGVVMTYYKSSDFRSPSEIEAKLVEYCNWGIAGGTSARYITSCTRFNQSEESLFVQNKNLP